VCPVRRALRKRGVGFRALRTGYRTDSERHVEARKKVPARRRRAIALLGGEAFRKNRGLPAK